MVTYPTNAAGANDLEASEFLAALLSFGMGVEDAKFFAEDHLGKGNAWSFQRSQAEHPGQITAGAFGLFSAEREGDKSG